MTTIWRHAVVFLPIHEVGNRRLILLARRRHGKSAGCLTPPGGELEDHDESLYAAVVRECKEELHITPTFPTVYAGGVAIVYHSLVLHVFIGNYSGQPMQSDELENPMPYSADRLPRGMREDAYLWVSDTLEHFKPLRYRPPRFLCVTHSDRGDVRRLERNWPADLRLPRKPWWPPPS